MPTSIAAMVASAFVADAVGTYVGSTIIGYIAGGIAAGVIGQALAPTPAPPPPPVIPALPIRAGVAPALTVEQPARMVSVRQAAAPWQRVYGQTRIGGIITYVEATENDQTLHLVITLASHAVQEIGAIYFDDELVPLDDAGAATGKYAGYASVYKSYGDEASTTQPFAQLELLSAGLWTSEHKQYGHAKLHVKLSFNADLYPNGIPNITAVVKGKKVYDPRTGLTVYSANAALCISDFLTDTETGLGAVYADEINDAQLIAAANVCDEAVTLDAGGTETRYEIHGAYSSGATPKDTLARLLTAMAGRARYLGGTWWIFPAAYASPSVTLTVDDLRGAVHIQPRLSRRDVCNGVKGVYVSPDNAWQPSDFPPVTNVTYTTEDQGERIWLDIDLPFTKSAPAAQRIAKIELERVRQQITLMLPCKLTAWQVQPGDTVLVTLARYGYAAKAFEVLEASLAHESDGDGIRLGVDLVLRETAAAVYTWSAEETTVDPAPDSNLPDPFSIDALVGLELASGTDQLFIGGDGTITSRILASWVASTDAFVTQAGRIEVQFKLSSDSTWRAGALAMGSDSGAYVGPVEDGELYDVRIRAVNSIGIRSAWTTSTDHTVIGKTALPSDITSFTLEGRRVSWSEVDDLDLAGYVIRFQTGINRSWGDAAQIHAGFLTSSPYDLPTLTAGQVTLMVKAVDTTGNESENPAFIITDIGDAVVANVLAQFDRHAAGWPGTLTNGTAAGSPDALAANSTTLMWKADDSASMWSADSTDLMWAAAQYAQMTYEDRITVSSVLAGSAMTIDADIAGDPWKIEYRENSGALWWSVDDSTPMWSSDSSTLMWDTPPYQTWPGSITARASIYDFRVTTGQGQTQGVISTFTITIDAPDITEALGDVTIAAGGTRLPITRNFTSIEVVNLTLQTDGGAAETARIEDKDVDLGPRVKCYNAAGAAVAGLVDAIVQGY